MLVHGAKILPVFMRWPGKFRPAWLNIMGEAVLTGPPFPYGFFIWVAGIDYGTWKLKAEWTGECDLIRIRFDPLNVRLVPSRDAQGGPSFRECPI